MPVLAIGLAACGGGSAPQPAALKASPASERHNVDPSPTPSTAATSSPTESNPADPKAAVEAAVRAYFDAANIALSTGDTKRLRELTTSDCTCLRFASSLENLHGQGGTSRGASWHLKRIKVAFGVAPNQADVFVGSVFSAYQDLDASGSIIESVPEQQPYQDFIMQIEGGIWRVSDVDAL
jgi:hypothetical protein